MGAGSDHSPGSTRFLARAAERLLLPFPAGLSTPVGIVVANPAYAPEPALRASFGPEHYHGAVVWSWQHAMLEAGRRKQLDRRDLPEGVQAAIEQAHRRVQGLMRRMASLRTTELWSWRVREGTMQAAPFGQDRTDADESNAVQLWSTVSLGAGLPAQPPMTVQ